VARRAGTQTARKATTLSRTGVARKAVGSQGSSQKLPASRLIGKISIEGAVLAVLGGALGLLVEPAVAGTIATMDQRMANSLVAPRFNAGLLALLLAVVGIYGVISHSASRRTHEIGIRMALGALPANVLRLVMGEALAITALGIGLGLAACLGLMRYLASLLFEIRPTDSLTIAAVSLIVGAVALQASYLPARRATKVDPMAALRCE